MSRHDIYIDGATGNSRRHARIGSHLVDLFDCCKAMLDVGQPGELPLMRELTALKRARSLRDPSTVSNWNPTGTSPFKASTGRTTTETDRVAGRGGDQQSTGTSARRISRRGALPKASPLSEAVRNSGGRQNWDLGIVMEDARGEQGGIFGEFRKKTTSRTDSKTKHARNRQGEQALLHNWRNPSRQSDMETIPMPESYHNASKHAGISSRRDTTLGRRRGNAFDFENPAESRIHLLKKTSTKQGSSRQNAQILSPLVLNSADDNHPSHSLSLFTLDGPYYNHRHQHERPKEGLDRSAHVASQPVSPLSMKHLARSSLREPVKRSWSSQLPLTSSTSDSQRTTLSQGSVVGAWEAASNQLDDELNVSELPRTRCGIPCYWSKNQKRGKTLLDAAGRGFSFGFSDASRRKGNSSSKLPSGPQREMARYTADESPALPLGLEGTPLLTEPSAPSDDAGGSSPEDSDRLSSDLNGELGLDCGTAMKAPRSGVSDGQDMARSGLSSAEGKELAIFVERPRSLSQKYRPKVFQDLVGQKLVVHALSNAILRGKIAPVYLFQGSRGTGKTSAARIFAAALNCVTSDRQRPCGVCRECVALASGKSTDVREVDAASNNGIEKVKSLLQSTFSAASLSRYKVFIVDECHMLTNETWNALLKLLEEPPGNLVFILITTDPDKLPRTAVSRCQRFPFPKIKDSEIASRLQTLAKLEKLDVEPGALDLIASRSDGSLRDAETILDQLTLFGHRITLSMVHELVGSVSEEKLLSLLDLALCSDTVRTVQRARELVDSGVEPLDLMSQLATLITDILAGSCEMMNRDQNGGFFSRHALSEEELERLRMALKILSEAEKQLRAVSNDRTTWLTAALLQFGPDRSFMFPVSSSTTSVTATPTAQSKSINRKNRVSEAINVRKGASRRNMSKEGSTISQKKSNRSTVKSKGRPTKGSFNVRVHPADQSYAASRELSNEGSPFESPVSDDANITHISFVSPGNLGIIWFNVLERCKTLPLRQMLHAHGNLSAVSISTVDALVHLEFANPEQKSRAERSKKSIANAFQTVLGLPVEVKISLASLPAESLGSRVWTAADQTAVTQGGFQQNASTSAADGKLQPEDHIRDAASLHYWRSRGGVAYQDTMEQVISPRSFLAIPKFHSTSLADLITASRSPNNRFGVQSSMRSGQRGENTLPEEERLESAWISEARRHSPLHQSDSQTQNKSRAQEIVMEDTVVAQQAPHLVHDTIIDGAFPGCNADRNPIGYGLEEENLNLEPRFKYGGLLCWKAPEVEEKKVKKQRRRRKCGIIIRLVPCAKSKSQ